MRNYADRYALDQYLARLTLRSHLPAAERQAVLDLPSRTSRPRAGTDLIHCGDAVDSATIVVSGLVSSFKQSRDGTRRIMALHIDGDMADLPSTVLDEAVNGLEALTDASLLHVQLGHLRALSARYPAIAAAMVRDCAIDASIQVEWAANIGGKHARGRLAHLFCEMAARYETVGKCVGLSFELPMTQQHLADATAMTPIHLNRTLMGLRAEGIVEMRSRVVEVYDWAALAEAGDFTPDYLRCRSLRPH